jgi:Spy/CpxP family protein refolding chaperone
MTPQMSSFYPRAWRLMAATVLIVAVAAGVATAQTQTPPPRGAGAAGRGDQSGPAEVQRLFDAYSVIRAQEALKLDDEQFAQFLPKLTALQETRRRNERAHNQIVAELGRLTGPNAQVDEAQVREKLKALQDLDVRAAAELRKAYDAIDQALDVKQQARFRVFELQMERRKLELMLQARRGEAARRMGPAAPIKKLDPSTTATSSKQIRVP